MTYLVYFAYIAPPMIALFVSRYAKSMVAKWLLRGAAVVCILTFGLVLLANYDCVQAEFSFSSCDRLPDAFGDVMGPVQIIFVVSYLVVGPVVLLLAVGFEWWAHRRPRAAR